MKYVMLSFTHVGIERQFPVIFPNDIIHSEAAKAFEGALRNSISARLNLKVVSAGELNVRVEVHADSRSVSIGAASRPEDTAHINGIDYNHGIVG